MPDKITRGWMWGAFAFTLAVALTRFKSLGMLWVDGQIFFADADCYARMTRVARLVGDGQWVQRFHDFEDSPHGVVPHTTAPLDWLLGAFAGVAGIWTQQPLEWAALLAPPLVGAAAGLVLYVLAARLLPNWARWPLLLTYLLSPMLLWANAALRPDHQMLTVPLTLVAITASCISAKQGTGWRVFAGACWGLALWTSLWEPLILLTLWTAVRRLNSMEPGGLPYWLPLVLIPLFGLLVDGWRLQGAALLADPFVFQWMHTIGELKSAPWYFWLHLFPLGVVLLVLVWRHRRAVFPPPAAWWRGTDPLVRSLGILTAVLIVLTLIQLRWSYWVPWMGTLWLMLVLRDLRAPWLRMTVIFLAVIPPAAWNFHELRQMRPDTALAEVREMAEAIDGEGAVLAPWWSSPALVYYSGNPAVAGSSHQSIRGIVDSAVFFTTDDFTLASAILEKRGVRWIAVTWPQNTYPNSLQILYGKDRPEKWPELAPARIVSIRLWNMQAVPKNFRLVYVSPDWKLFEFVPER